MKEKLLYETPEVDIVNLSIGGAILDASVNASGADVTFEDSSTFDAIFM